MDYKRLLKVIVAIVILSITTYFIFSYFSNNDLKEIPIIEADIGETKVKPLDAGGIILPHADNVIYENMGRSSSTRKITILPEPEQALPIASQKNIDSEFENSIDSMLASVIAPDQTGKPIEDDQVAESIFEDTQRTQALEPSIPEAASNNSTNAKTLNIVKVTENSNKRIGSIKSFAQPKKNNYKIQLASMKSEALAIVEGERIKRKHLKVLGNSVITNKKVQQEKDKFFYIILAGDYLTPSKAQAACKKLSARQQSCMIYHP